MITGKINQDGSWGAGLARVFDVTYQQSLAEELDLEPGDLLLVAGGPDTLPVGIILLCM